MREIAEEICGITVWEHIKTGSKIWYLSSDWFFSKDWNLYNEKERDSYRGKNSQIESPTNRCPFKNPSQEDKRPLSILSP